MDKPISIYRLDENDPTFFPTPYMIPDDERDELGLIAVGGDFTPERLIFAYSVGGFPWSDFRRDEPYWYNPMERFVLFPDEVHVSHSMRTLFNGHRYEVSVDSAFDLVVENCSRLRIEQQGAWLGPELVETWKTLHKMNWAHSIEVWDGDELVGGFYGMSMGRLFMGDSMFSLKPNASKYGLIHFCREIAPVLDIRLIDCQSHTPHLASLGARHIPYALYQKYLPLLDPDDDTPADDTPADDTPAES